MHDERVEPSKMSRALLRNALIVFTLALTVRWMADAVLQPHLGSYVIDAYDVMGQNLLNGHGFSYQAGKSIPTVTRAPFYPVWWAAELAVFGRNFLLLRMAEGFVDAVTAALVVFMTAALCRLPPSRAPPTASDDGTAMSARQPLIIPTLAGAAYAIQPFSIYYAAKMGTETWFTLWLVLFLWCFVEWCLAPGYGRGAVLGGVLGILMLNKSTAVGLLILLALLGVIWTRQRRKVAYLSLVLCIAVSGLVVTPWVLRDFRVSGGYLVPIQSLTWWNFWADFDFGPGGYLHTVSSHYGPGGGHPYSLSAAADVQQEARLRDQALQWISLHPVAMLSKMGHNLIEFWYLVEGVRRSQVTLAASALELLLAFAGGWLAWRERRRRMVLLVAVVILYFDVVYTPIKSVFHYSLVVVPFLCVLQAFLLAWVLARLMGRTHSSLSRPSSDPTSADRQGGAM
jgi:4-amino-4-deoxy-L-arabinose transferase-like glycosyltransferase